MAAELRIRRISTLQLKLEVLNLEDVRTYYSTRISMPVTFFASEDDRFGSSARASGPSLLELGSLSVGFKRLPILEWCATRTASLITGVSR